MKSSIFDYELSSDRIAQTPTNCRSASRLLDFEMDGSIEDRYFSDLPSMLDSNDLLILNNTWVLSAKMFARKALSGGRVEILIERQIGDDQCLAQVRASKSVTVGTCLVTSMGSKFVTEGRDGPFYRLRIESKEDLAVVLDREGEVPLPPYIRRSPNRDDRSRYQTIYARVPGAVAAPTAGLHFDKVLFSTLKQRGIATEFITLHVGAGTFQPIRAEHVRDHQMHSEWISVPERVIEAIEITRRRGGRVVAVGTTVVRALESAALTGELISMEGDTDLFIVPGFHFRVVDALITNFHLPKSSLLVLVSAFAGLETVQKIYSHAIEKGYRFYSYGDAMCVQKAGTKT
jgi:S-adenosylmethionine:tRNA ribosyltransferase-isomerase